MLIARQALSRPCSTAEMTRHTCLWFQYSPRFSLTHRPFKQGKFRDTVLLAFRHCENFCFNKRVYFPVLLLLLLLKYDK